MDGSTVMEICAYQWRLYNEYCNRDLPTDDTQVIQVRYEEMSSNPGPVLQAIARFADIDPQPLERFAEKLPVVNTWSKPSADKWKRVEDQIETVLPLVASEAERLGYPT
jgi:hypothetical protein